MAAEVVSPDPTPTPIAREIAGTPKPHVASLLKNHPPRLRGSSQE
jgi:hypothetical protein